MLGVAVILHLMLLLDAIIVSTCSWIVTLHVVALLCAEAWVESLVFVIQWMQWVENARVAISLC